MSCKTDNEKKAEKFLSKRLAEVLTGTHTDAGTIRYEDLRAAYILDYKTNKRKSLHRDKEGNVYLDAVKRLDDFFTGYRASEIDASVVRQFIADQQAKGLSNASINRSTSSLRRMFRLALEDERLRTVPHFVMLKEAAPRSGFFEFDQFQKLFAALPDYLRLPLAIGYYCGMRRGEVLNLKWERVNFLENKIVLLAGQTKNDRGRTIPIVPPLRALLVEQHAKRREGCPYVCFRLDRRGRAAKIGSFRKVWQSRCIKLGFGTMEATTDPATGETLNDKPRKDRRNAKPKPKMVYHGLLYHDLRRTFVRNLVRSGTPEKTCQKLSGHLSRQVFDRYNISSEKDVVEAGEKLAAYFEKNGHNSGTVLHQNAAENFPVH